MNWPDDFYRMQSLCKDLGSPYAAALYTAKKSRQLFHESKGVMTYGESIRYALTDERPKDLDQRISKSDEVRKRRFFLPVEDVLSNIDDNYIRDAVSNSYRLSINAHHLEYDYKDIEDENLRARIRILTKMCYAKSMKNRKE